MTAERDLVRKGQEETDVTRCSSADLLSHELSLSEDRSEVNTDGLTVVDPPSLHCSSSSEVFFFFNL